MHVVMHLCKYVDVTHLFSHPVLFFASSEKVGKRHLKEGCISYSEHVATWELMNCVMLEHAATLSTSLGKNVDLNYEK